MRKFLLLVILLFLAFRYGGEYILSEDFQKYGDREKAQWTCRVNNVLGGMYQIGSEYQRAFQFYDRVLTRCPATTMAEEALFQKAACLENMMDPLRAISAYEEYIEKHPHGESYKSALRSIDRIKLSR